MPLSFSAHCLKMTKQKQQDVTEETPDDGGLTKRHALGIATMIMIALLTLFAAFVLMGIAFFKYRYVSQGPLATEQVFEIKKGTGLSSIANNKIGAIVRRGLQILVFGCKY